MDSILEITENEYLIKLNRDQFNLPLVRSLLKMVEIFNPLGDEDKPSKRHISDLKAKLSSSSDDDDDIEIPDRHIAPDQNHNDEPDYFDSLDEK